MYMTVHGLHLTIITGHYYNHVFRTYIAKIIFLGVVQFSHYSFLVLRIVDNDGIHTFYLVHDR